MGFLRPDDWNLPLLVHVGGAMLLVGSLVAVAAVLLAAARAGSSPQTGALARLGFRTLLLAALPSYIVMRVGAQWIASKEGREDSEEAWIVMGYITSEAGFLLLIAVTVVAGLAARRFRRGDAAARASRVAPVLALVLVAVYLVAVWAMTAKPI